MNALTRHEGGALSTIQGGFSLAPRNLDEAFRLADMLADSDLVPKDFRGKPGNCMIAIQWGSEIGLKPLQALQNLAVINGRPCLWGDALIALVRSSPLCEYVTETTTAQGTAVCQVKRRGEPEQTRTFSDADAKTAGLLGKQGPWQTSPSRMKQMRARAFALRDVFPDVLKGIAVAEEVMDYADPAAPANLAPNDREDVPAWIGRMRATTTDGEAATVWAEGNKAIAATKNMGDYTLFKDATVAHRLALKTAHDASRTVDAATTETGSEGGTE